MLIDTLFRYSWGKSSRFDTDVQNIIHKQFEQYMLHLFKENITFRAGGYKAVN